jgi:hypothetical protein
VVVAVLIGVVVYDEDLNMHDQNTMTIFVTRLKVSQIPMLVAELVVVAETPLQVRTQRYAWRHSDPFPRYA